MEYKSLVLVNLPGSEEVDLFYAPGFTVFMPGDIVLVDTKDGAKVAQVIDCETFNTERDEFMFLIKAMQIKEPIRKVLSRVRTVDIEY